MKQRKEAGGSTLGSRKRVSHICEVGEVDLLVTIGVNEVELERCESRLHAEFGKLPVRGAQGHIREP